jgi:hypothetical protein
MRVSKGERQLRDRKRDDREFNEADERKIELSPSSRPRCGPSSRRSTTRRRRCSTRRSRSARRRRRTHLACLDAASKRVATRASERTSRVCVLASVPAVMALWSECPLTELRLETPTRELAVSFAIPP